MKVLGIETATRAGGAAIVDGSGLVGEIFDKEGPTHSRRLLPAIDRLLADAGWRPRDIDLVAVSVGPGSFTGLRIGLAAAKGFVMASGAEIIGVSTLDAFAHLVAKASYGLPILPVIDARKSEVFTARFDARGKRESEDENISPEALAEKVRGRKAVLAGDGARLYGDILMAELDSSSLRADPRFDDPRPCAVAEMGLILHEKGARCDLATLAPVYVRAPDAVINPRSPARRRRI